MNDGYFFATFSVNVKNYKYLANWCRNGWEGRGFVDNYQTLNVNGLAVKHVPFVNHINHVKGCFLCRSVVFCPFSHLCSHCCSKPIVRGLGEPVFMSSLCGVGVCARVRVCVNNFSSKTTRPRDVLFFLKDT